MHQQFARIFIASLGDPRQPRSAAGRHLTRYQAEPGGEVAPARKCRGIADRRRQGCRIQHTDAGNPCQATGRIIGLGPRRELGVECLNAAVQRGPFRAHASDQRPHARAQLLVIAAQHRREMSLKLASPLRDGNAPLQQQSPELVRQCRPLANQPVAHAMEGPHVELLGALQLDKPHRRPRCRLGDRFRVPIVVLPRLDVRPDVFGRHQADLMSMLTQSTAEVVRTAAGLHRHHAGSQAGGELEHALPLHPSAQDDLSSAVQADHTAAVLPQVDPENCTLHGHAPFPPLAPDQPTPPERGAGHPIRLRRPGRHGPPRDRPRQAARTLVPGRSASRSARHPDPFVGGARQPTACAYLFGAICPSRAVGAAVIMPSVNAEAMTDHLAEISTQVARGAHAVLACDSAGWHRTGRRLGVPDNITLLPLPPYCPELNPMENVWEYLRTNRLCAVVWDSYEAFVEACRTAWNFLINDPERIRSIGTRGWACVSL